MDEGDYVALSTLSSAKGVRSSSDDSLREYYGVFRAADCYEETFVKIISCLSDSNITDSDITSISSQLHWFYKSFDDYADYGKDNPRVIKFNEEIKRDMNILLRTYLGISQETADKVPEMSEGQMAVMIEEAFNEKSSQK